MVTALMKLKFMEVKELILVKILWTVKKAVLIFFSLVSLHFGIQFNFVFAICESHMQGLFVPLCCFKQKIKRQCLVRCNIYVRDTALDK